MDTAERALLDQAVRDALASAGDGAGADAALGEIGWLEMLAAEPREAIAIVFGALGATDRAATALDDVVASGIGAQPRADLAVVLPAFGDWDAPGRAGLATARITTASEVLVVEDSGTDLAVVLAPADRVRSRAVRGIDPAMGLQAVDVESDGFRRTRASRAAWESAVALGRRAVAHQISGASRAMLDLARTHALERVQFGRPIASFQAVRHRLAEALVAVEALEATLDAAADEPGTLTAALAKATAGRTARTVAVQCQQVLAGIGFTTDHPFHRYLERTMLLEGVFGSTDALTVDIGRQLLAARHVPTLIEL